MFKCYECKEFKPKEDFYLDNTRSNGVTSRCKECHKIYRKKHNQQWRKDPLIKIIGNQKRRVRKICQTNGFEKKVTFDKIFGIDSQGLKVYLESMFKEGMTWDNYLLNEWEVDHIVPLFNVETFDDLVRLCHYTNIQPLWKHEHDEKTFVNKN